jgi:hypothetical protein
MERLRSFSLRTRKRFSRNNPPSGLAAKRRSTATYKSDAKCCTSTSHPESASARCGSE